MRSTGDKKLVTARQAQLAKSEVGMIPLVLGWGTGPSVRLPMAIAAAVGGPMASTLLNLLAAPQMLSK
ncbi:hypothetical protein [Rhodoferax ferrireducens]|uniref:hypothetical protein n=1 Tax=Rhodoferax ferrireducens TaxID=192843 RepID=UPI0013005644|nr:hypothetical protein [Rhodoferax ferrireducens]